MNNAALEHQRGTWVAPDVVEWGDWGADIMLDEYDRTCLRAEHYPYRYNENRAITVKKALQHNKSIASLAKEMRGLRGYSKRSLMKDATALSKAKAQRS